MCPYIEHILQIETIRPLFIHSYYLFSFLRDEDKHRHSKMELVRPGSWHFSFSIYKDETIKSELLLEHADP